MTSAEVVKGGGSDEFALSDTSAHRRSVKVNNRGAALFAFRIALCVAGICWFDGAAFAGQEEAQTCADPNVLPDKIVTVKGHVMTPQRVRWIPTLTALDAIGNAGGFEWNFPKFVYVLRNGERISVRVKNARENRNEDVVLQPDDVVEVP